MVRDSNVDSFVVYEQGDTDSPSGGVHMVTTTTCGTQKVFNHWITNLTAQNRAWIGAYAIFYIYICCIEVLVEVGLPC